MKKSDFLTVLKIKLFDVMCKYYYHCFQVSTFKFQNVPFSHWSIYRVWDLKSGTTTENASILYSFLIKCFFYDKLYYQNNSLSEKYNLNKFEQEFQDFSVFATVCPSFVLITLDLP